MATLFAWAPAILFGVNVHTLFIWNLLLLTISLLVFFLLIKPDCRVGVLILFMMLSNGVLMEQWYSHMMELPCVAVIVLYFTFQLMYERTNKKAWLVLTIVTCIYASFMRICYIVLLFPIIFLLCLERGKKIRIWPFVVYLIGFGIIYKGGDLFKKQSAGFLTSISSLGMKEKLLMLLDNTLRNLRLYFSIYNGSHVEVGQRYFQVGLLLLLFTVAFISFRDGLFSYTFRKVYFASAISLAGLIIMMMVLYDVADWRDVRTTMPYAFGLTMWFLVRCFSQDYVIDNGAVGKVAGIFLLLGMIVTTTVFVPEKFVTNHPADRYAKMEYDDSWIDIIPNENLEVCIYGMQLGDTSRFHLYQKLPPHVGILITYDYNALFNNSDAIDYIISSEELSLPDYTVIATSDDYGLIYGKQ